MSTSVDVYIYGEDGVNSGFVSAAVDAINNHMAPQFPFNIWAQEEDIDGSFDTGYYNDASNVLTQWHNYLKDHPYALPIDAPPYEYHMVIVDNYSAAGYTMGNVGQGSKGYAYGFTNASSNLAAQCYGVSGDKAFKATVIHEVAHSLLDATGLIDSINQTPSDGCFDGNSRDHSLGEVYTGRSGKPVTPMQLWYTGDPCSGNSPPCDNCGSGTDNESYSQDITYDFSRCAYNEICTYVDHPETFGGDGLYD